MQTKSARNASTLMYSWTQVFLSIWNEHKMKIKKTQHAFKVSYKFLLSFFFNKYKLLCHLNASKSIRSL